MLQQIDEAVKTDEEYISRRSLVKTLKTFAPEHFTPLIDLLITKEPAADVVEVVRCKDCKHSCFVKSCSKYECTRCGGKLKYSSDFCSYGEPKDEVKNG